MRLLRDHWLVPIALGTGLVAIIVATSVMAPPELRPAALPAAASISLLASFLWLPKPTLLVFALLMLFHQTLGGWLDEAIGRTDEIVVPAMFVISAWRLRPWRHGLLEPLRDCLVVCFLALAVVSSLVHGVPVAVWLVGLLLAAKVFAFLYVVAWHDFTPRDVRQFTPLVLGVGVVVAGLAFVELIDPVAFDRVLALERPPVPREGLPSLKSLFFHPGLLGWFAAFVGLFLFAYHALFRRWWLLCGGLLFSLTVVLTARRRAIAGLVLGLAAGVVRHLGVPAGWRERLRVWGPAAAGLVLLLAAFLPALLGLVDLTIRETPPPGAQPEAENARLALYRTSIVVANDHFPLGAGLGRYGSAMSRVDYSPLYARYGLDRVPGLGPDDPAFVTDTFWPKILGETGAFGLLAYLGFTAVLGVSLWRAVPRLASDPFAQAFAVAALMVFAQALVETLASSMFQSPSRIYLLFGAVGVALALARSPSSTVVPADHGAAP